MSLILLSQLKVNASITILIKNSEYLINKHLGIPCGQDEGVHGEHLLLVQLPRRTVILEPPHKIFI